MITDDTDESSPLVLSKDEDEEFQKKPLVLTKNDDFQEPARHFSVNEDEKKKKKKRIIDLSLLVMGFIMLGVIILLCGVGIGLYFLVQYLTKKSPHHRMKCSPSCTYKIVESITTNTSLELLPGSITTTDSYIHLLRTAKKRVIYAEFYWSLNNTGWPNAAEGRLGNSVVQEILAAHKRGIFIEILYGVPGPGFLDTDIPIFQKAGIPVYEFDFQKYFGGVFHTKMMIRDNDGFYIGSANMDWRSLSQVKELGIQVESCECLAHDLELQYKTYKDFYNNNGKLSQKYDTDINLENPIHVPFVGDPDGTLFFASSPAPINTKHRTDDIVALTTIMNRAEEYMNIAVMKFVPAQIYTAKKAYWDEIDSAIRAAVMRGVNVHLSIADWAHTQPTQIDYLYTLYYYEKMCKSWVLGGKPQCPGNITISMMKIGDDPNFSPQAPFSRVNHAKYVITEKDCAILNSNFAKDYFYDTSGMTVYSTHKGMRESLNKLFWRDWNSEYSRPLTDYTPTSGANSKFAEVEDGVNPYFF